MRMDHMIMEYVCFICSQKIMFCFVFAIAMWVMTGVQVTFIDGLLLPQLICVFLAMGVKLFRNDHNVTARVSWIFGPHI